MRKRLSYDRVKNVIVGDSIAKNDKAEANASEGNDKVKYVVAVYPKGTWITVRIEHVQKAYSKDMEKMYEEVTASAIRLAENNRDLNYKK